MMSHSVNGQPYGAKIIPFRRLHRDTRQQPQVTLPDSGDPEKAWRWAAANSHRIFGIVRQSAQAQGVLGQIEKLDLHHDGGWSAARLVLAVCYNLDVNPQTAVRVAAACELQHTTALVCESLNQHRQHLPLRRSAKRDLLVGKSRGTTELLSALAYEIVVTTPCAAKQKVDLVTALSRSTVQALTCETSTTLGLCPIDDSMVPRYERLIRNSAGPGFALPVESALVLAELPKAQLRRAREAMRAFAMAARIQCEANAVFGDPLKSTVDANKSLDLWSAPVIWYLARANATEREQLRRCLTAETPLSRAEIRIWRRKIRASTAASDCDHHATRIRQQGLGLLRRLPPPLRECLHHGLGHITLPCSSTQLMSLA